MKILSKNLLLLPIILCNCSRSTNEGTKSGSFESDINTDKAELIVKNSIDAHGGWESWEDLKEISYNKTTMLFDSSGKEESRVLQKHNYIINPKLEGSIQWVDGEYQVKILFEDGQGIKYINEVAELNSESMESATGSFLSAFYVLFQPWKLLDPGTSLEYIGEDILADGREVLVVSPAYRERKVGDDQWWYYIDKESKLLVANMVNHDGRYSLISNLEYDNSSNMVFNYHRKSHFVDSARNINYLRAEYFYENFQLTFEE